MQVDPTTLGKAVVASFGKFDHFRRARSRFMAQTVTRFYNRSRRGRSREEDRASPLNLMYTAVTTMVPNLVFNEPRSKARSDILAYRDYAESLELATDNLTKKINLRMTLRKTVYDSIFLAGFVKTGLSTSDQYIPFDGQDIQIGQPYAERIDPDDIILDPWARDWDAQSFIGHRYRADLDDLMASGIYDENLLNTLSKQYAQSEQRRVSGISGSDQNMSNGEIRRFVELCDLYLPQEQLVVTIPYTKDGKADEFLRSVEYEGPASGPYHMLGYTAVSDNVLPVAPAMVWYDLHTLGNRIARKLARQAERLKSVLAYQGEAEEDVEQIAEADDGETVKVQDINLIKEVKYGGATPDAYTWMDWVKKNFSEQANSIDLLSGTGANAPTATQSEMLQANTSVRLSDMQAQVYHFTAEIVRDLAYFLHTDPLIELPLTKRVNGQQTQVMYTPEMREGDFFDYTFTIEPYSMARPDPNTALRRKLEFATNVIPAAAQAAQMLGPGFNAGAFLKDIAREVQLDTADEWLVLPEIQAWIVEKMRMASIEGQPGKAGMGVPTPPLNAALPPMFNPGQPNPSQMGPNGGIMPDTEQAQAQQETSGDLQAGQKPSARALALVRG